MNEIVITAKGLLWVLAAIVTLGGATAVISRWLTPFRNYETRLTALEAEVKECRNYQNIDHKELGKLELGIEKICKCTLAITDHELTGNSVDKLRAAKDEMQNYLIEK